VNGTIKKIASGDVPRVAGWAACGRRDLMTVDSFADFELSFEWKVTSGGEQRRQVQRLPKRCRWPKAARHAGRPHHSALGFEVSGSRRRPPRGRQAPLTPLRRLVRPDRPNAQKVGCAACCALLHPVGEWNRSRIVVRGNHGGALAQRPESRRVRSGHRPHGFPPRGQQVQGDSRFG